jgi:hypothetical protein
MCLCRKFRVSEKAYQRLRQQQLPYGLREARRRAGQGMGDVVRRIKMAMLHGFKSVDAMVKVSAIAWPKQSVRAEFRS